jgi:regulator of sigma E protease
MLMSVVTSFSPLLSINAVAAADVTAFIRTPLSFLFVLGVVVFVHEFGHFMVARMCGVTVETFSIGFGPELGAFTDRKGTRWRLAAVPLGGYVKFKGDENAASMPSQEALGTLTADERQGNFHTAPLIHRSLIVAAGPVANFILAIAIFTVVLMVAGKVIIDPKIGAIEAGSPAEKAGLKVGDRVLAIGGSQVHSFDELDKMVWLSADQELMLLIDRGGISMPIRVVPVEVERKDVLDNNVKVGYIGASGPSALPKIESVEPGSPADKAGLKPGDRVIAIGDEPIRSFDELQKKVVRSPGQELSLAVDREGGQVPIRVTPGEVERKDAQGNPFKAGFLGVRGPSAPADSHIERYGPVTALGMAVSETGAVAMGPVIFIRDLIARRADYRQLGGPIGIAELSGKVAAGGFMNLIRLTAIISVSIGLLNLFPIPVLDGGHLLYYGIEAILGRPMSQEAQEFGFKIGLFLILVLMLFATWNDLSRLLNSFA